MNKVLKFKPLYIYIILTLVLIATWTPDARIPKSIKYETVQQLMVTSKHKPKKMKYILQWTSPDTIPFSFWGKGQSEFFRRRCKITDCYVTSNIYLLDSVTYFDVIAFHGPEIKPSLRGPRFRSSQQKYVFVSMESSHNYPVCFDRYDSFFNWTWTYRLDSELPYGYITVRNIEGHIIGPKKIMHWLHVDSMKPINNEMKQRLSTKSKVAAWFVSNCYTLSKRFNHAARLRSELNKYGLSLDIFGECGIKQCPTAKMDECLKIIEKEYYFYLSFENSFSKDYVTEKLLWPLQNYAVPVVFGAANYTR